MCALGRLDEKISFGSYKTQTFRSINGVSKWLNSLCRQGGRGHEVSCLLGFQSTNVTETPSGTCNPIGSVRDSIERVPVSGVSECNTSVPRPHCSAVITPRGVSHLNGVGSSRGFTAIQVFLVESDS